MNAQAREAARERKRRELERKATGAPVLRCGARTKHGPCGLAAGWGTDHVGAGRCRRHGGASPSGRKAAAREQAIQEVDLTARQLRFANPGDVIELALAVANHRVEKVQERHGAQLDAGDLALLSIEGETLDRAARIAKLAFDLDIDSRRARIADEQARVIVEAMNAGLRAVFPDATPEERSRFADAVADSLARHEPEPSALLDGRRER